MRHSIVIAAAVGSGVLLVSGCRVENQGDRTSSQAPVIGKATPSSAVPPRRDGTSLQLGAIHLQEWGNVSALTLSKERELPSDMQVRVLARTCILSTDAHYAFLAPAMLSWTLSDDTGHSYASLSSRARVGHAQPIYAADSGPMRIGTCLKNRVDFHVPKRSAPLTVTYTDAHGKTATWDLPPIVGPAGPH